MLYFYRGPKLKCGVERDIFEDGMCNDFVADQLA